MPCYGPLKAYKGKERTQHGKRAVVFRAVDGYVDLPLELPCGQCFGCRLERSRQWAMRCMHEASLYDQNAFLTLTYDDEHLPAYGSLKKSDFQLFMKRLRKAAGKLRFFHCGEYGEKTLRPHYHALIFGFNFPDRYQWSDRGGCPVFRSPMLEKLWTLGASEIGSVTFESAAYVARYVVKKLTEEDAYEQYRTLDVATGEMVPVEPEYATMSRRPGIGTGWYEKFGAESYGHDSVVMRGIEMKPPKFYDNKLESEDEKWLRAVKQARKRAQLMRREESEPERLKARETVARARYNTYARKEL